jgi:nickel-dependent lactate racemase
MATTVGCARQSLDKLTPDQVRDVVREAVQELRVRGKRVLTILPDGTRTMPMPLMFKLLQEALTAEKAAASDYLIALGTHRAMDDAQLSAHLGQDVRVGKCGSSNISNHRWELPDTFRQIGTISAAEVRQLSGGLLREEVPVKVNGMIFDYHQVLICGPVFPHEVVGFSGGNKYLFPGISGREMIDATHWLGALLYSMDIIGAAYTPVRAMIDRAAAMITVPISCLALVLAGKDPAGIFFGSAESAWQAASALSSQRHIAGVDRPFKRAVAVMPAMYQDMWTAAKGMYKLEPAMQDGGEIIIYAPHITEFSYVHKREIEEIGYHCRDYFLAGLDRFANISRGVLAHSTHLKGKGAFVNGVEKPRLRVTLATGISQERCHGVDLNYMDPRSLRINEWTDREDEGIKVVAPAGEMLFRLKR